MYSSGRVPGSEAQRSLDLEPLAAARDDGSCFLLHPIMGYRGRRRQDLQSSVGEGLGSPATRHKYGRLSTLELDPSLRVR